MKLRISLPKHFTHIYWPIYAILKMIYSIFPIVKHIIYNCSENPDNIIILKHLIRIEFVTIYHVVHC